MRNGQARNEPKEQDSQVGLRAVTAGILAFERLVAKAETMTGEQGRALTRLVAGLAWPTEFPIWLKDIKAAPPPQGDDVLLALDACRWGADFGRHPAESSIRAAALVARLKESGAH